jgi:photosystem II stability/assembly factor-like uncharacterized protein
MIRLIMTSILLPVLSGPSATGRWQKQAIPTDADFRGLSVVSSEIVWVSGTKGTFGHTTDGGTTWSVGKVPDAEGLDFRAVKAFGKDVAYLLSAGPGDKSRIYKTVDGGISWRLQYKCTDSEAFLDALAFWDESHGIALGDPVKGRFQLIVTKDGGTNWTLLPEMILPKALPNEGAFAASGTCLVAHGANDVWLATGGAKKARVFHSTDRGQTWTFSESPVQADSASAGIFSLAFRDRLHGMAVGGDYKKPAELGATAAVTADGGKSWTLIDKKFPYRSCVASLKDGWIVVGTSGSDYSTDDGATWSHIDRENYNSVAFSGTGEGWAVGPKGRIAKFMK